MKILKSLFGLTMVSLCTMSILVISDVHKVKAGAIPNSDASAEAEQSRCRGIVPGTYLTTILNADRTFASRGLITLTRDGNFIVSDSSQGGLAGVFNSFTTGQGSWVCTGERSITARVLDFSISNQGGTGIARIDYIARFNPNTNTIQGSITLSFFGLQDNPLSGNGISGGTTTFTGQRVTAP